MSRRALVGLAVAVVLVLAAGGAAAVVLLGDDEPAAQPPEPGQPPTTPEPGEQAAEPVLETVADGFDGAWGLAFLPDRDLLLVTQSSGTLSVVDPSSGELRDIEGVPSVDTGGQGGLLDVAVDPEFPESDWIYLTYSATDGGDATSTHLARGRLDLDQQRLDDVEVLFSAEPFLQSGAHYGSRVVFGTDGSLFMTIGDRGSKNFENHPSQDPSNHLGTTIRLAPDGSVPEDNPFLGEAGFADEIYSYGHRNVQGMTVHPETGELWQSEHGEEDGDEINVVEAGGNYGWPEASTACHYGTDDRLGDDPSEREDLVAPAHYWECGTGGFPPAGMVFYTGEEFPQWQGDLLVGSLESQYLARFTVNDHQLTEAEPLLADEGWRIRDVAVSPHDDAIYVAVDGADAPLLRLVNGAID